MKESKFQSSLIEEIKQRFKGCLVLKNDPNYLQGIPDLLILYKNKWAALEIKATAKSPIRPNQSYYVNKMDEMSYASFICPEVKEEVLHEIQILFDS